MLDSDCAADTSMYKMSGLTSNAVTIPDQAARGLAAAGEVPEPLERGWADIPHRIHSLGCGRDARRSHTYAGTLGQEPHLRICQKQVCWHSTMRHCHTPSV
jgi:hypothetical protein